MIDYEFYSLLKGGIMAGPRPSNRVLSSLSTLIDTVITLQWESESPEELETKCLNYNLTWIWCPIKAINWEVYKNDSIRSHILQNLQKAKDLLSEGHNLLIHCAAGVHRTGFFLYTLLRLCGKSPEQTLDSILTIRPKVIESIGKHRLEISENFYLTTQDQSVFTPYYETLDLVQSDYATGKKTLLFWVKVFFYGNLAKIQFSATVSDFSRIIVGGEIFAYVVERFQWSQFREFVPNGDEPIKSLWDVAEVIGDFIRSCQHGSVIYLAGLQCYWDKEFLSVYCSEIFDMISYRIVDLSCLQEIGGSLVQGSIYDDIRFIMKCRQNLQAPIKTCETKI